MSNSKNRFINLVVEKLNDKKIDRSDYKDRLKLEVSEINKLEAWDYFLGLYDEGTKYPENENNLLVAYLLDVVDDFDIETDPKWEYGDLPDVDIDYIAPVRDYLKNEWAPKTFGHDNVCNIGNYTTFGIKNSLIDMTRVFGESRDEILSITKNLGMRDDEGNILTWEGAINSNQKLREFCERHPEIADAAKRLVGRNRGRGKHAGGMIISNSSLDKLVPLVTDTDGHPVSAWSEGLHTQDLQPVGLVKYDLLSITNLMQIAKIVNLVKQRHGVKHVSALEGQGDWTDTSYLNHPKAIALANEAKLKGIFQFDSPGIREMVRKGGVDSFDDLVAFTSLYRPGPLDLGMHDRYIERKRGRESFELHPLLKPILGRTYGVLVYQEQIMQVLNKVGDIPLTDCEKVRKAISKKKEDAFLKYKPLFIINGQKNLGWTEEDVLHLWDQIVAFAEYGFNKSHAVAYTYISSRLLYLKALYTLEFFAGILEMESNEDKIKEYKLDVERFGIKVNRVDLNKSKERFSIVGDDIYMGFANIKGIGDEVAEQIVKGQPYDSFEDFLQRSGTNAIAIKRLIALNLFKECEAYGRSTLYEYFEYFKDYHKKNEDRKTRNQNTLNGRVEELQYLFNQAGLEIDATHEFFLSSLHYENITDFGEYLEEEYPPVLASSDVWPLLKKYKRSKLEYEKKVANNSLLIPLSQFEPTGKIDSKLKKLFEEDVLSAEIEFYGFGWEHLLTQSPDYQGSFTLSDFSKTGKPGDVHCVECQVVETPKQKKGKKKGTIYYVLRVEDAEWQQANVTIWEEDYHRFKEELDYWESDSRRGNLLHVRLIYPKPPLTSYTFDSPAKHLRGKHIPANKEEDARLIVMKRP